MVRVGAVHEVQVDHQVDADQRQGHGRLVGPAQRRRGPVLVPDELVHGACVIRIGDHDVGRELGAVGEAHAGDTSGRAGGGRDGGGRCGVGRGSPGRAGRVDQDPLHRGERADLAAVGLDHLDEPGGDHLAAALGVVGATHVVIDDRGVHRHGGLRRPAGVEPRPVVEHGLGALGQLALGEQLGERTERPAVERRRLDAGQHAGATLVRDGAQHPHHPLEAGSVVGERVHQTTEVRIPAGRDLEAQVGEVQRVEAVGVERAEHHAIADADAREDRREQPARPAVADVVDPDVELVLGGRSVLVAVVAAEHLGVAPRQVVRLEHEHPPPRSGQARCGGEAGRTRADHDDVPLLGRRIPHRASVPVRPTRTGCVRAGRSRHERSRNGCCDGPSGWVSRPRAGGHLARVDRCSPGR